MLEVVVATAMLATLASAVLGAMSFMESYNAHSSRRLNAMEVAHRLVTQYIDNQELMPPNHLPIQQGDRLYRWTLREEILVRDEAQAGLRKHVGKVASNMRAMDQIPEMLNRLTVTVYIQDPEDPLASARPLAELVRIYSPIFSGDPDEALKRILRLVEQVQLEQEEEAGRRPGDKAGK